MNLDFRCSCKSENNGEKLLPWSLVMKLFVVTSWINLLNERSMKLFAVTSWINLLNERRSYADTSIAVLNGCIACILVACDLYSSCRINKPQLSIGEWLRNYKETALVFFRSWSRYFSSMYFPVFFDKLSNKLLWLFCFFVFFSG